MSFTQQSLDTQLALQQIHQGDPMVAMHDFTDDDDNTSGPSGTTGGAPGASNPNTPPNNGGGAGITVNIGPGVGSGGPGGGGFDLDSALINYNKKFATADETPFREQVITQTLSVLISKNKPNALLVGPAGVGKTRIVEDIARRIATKDPSIPQKLAKSVIYELSLGALISGASFVGQAEERIQAVIDFATDPANNAVLFIDEIHVLANSKDQTYSKLAQLLKPALARGDMRTIGATTTQEGRGITEDPAFSRRFSKIMVDELTQEQTREVLESAHVAYLAHYNNALSIPPETLDYIVTAADDFLAGSSHRPDTALTLLDKSLAAMALVVEQDTKAGIVPFGVVPQLRVRHINDTGHKLMTGFAANIAVDYEALAEDLSHIISQEHVTETVVDQLRRDQLNVFPRTAPLTWMFAGSSGVGKTETAMVLAKHLTNTAPIIINMTEYTSPMSVTNLIGSSAGYVGSESNKEMPFDILDTNPRQVILLDEFEKADPTVQKLFMSAFDTGTMTMASGKTVNFTKSIIIATTNAAKDKIVQGGFGFTTPSTRNNGSGLDPAERKMLVSALSKDMPVELLNRFSWIAAYNQITREVYTAILHDLYTTMSAGVHKNKPHLAHLLPADIDDADIEQMVEHTYDPKFGARPAKRAMRRFIEDLIDPV